MKAKKSGREGEQAAIPQRQRAPSTAITKRKDSNKENNVQITEPLESLPYASKEFVLSRDSIRGNLKEIAQNQPPANNTKKTARESEREKERELEKAREREQELFDRRLSLKCTTNFSQQLESQKSHRLSVAPLRRESLGSNAVPQSLLE
jgi:hypothetical protein